MKKILLFALSIFCFYGCAPKAIDFIKNENINETRSIQSRFYNSANVNDIFNSTIATLQDLGFDIVEINRDAKLTSGMKNRDATEGGQVVGAVIFCTLDILSSAAGGGGSDLCSNYIGSMNDNQKISATVTTTKKDDKVYVRLTLQRLVFNKMGYLNIAESIKDIDLYQSFFDKLSKSIFLEENKI